MTRIVDTVSASSVAAASVAAANALEVRKQSTSEPLSDTPIKRMFSESGQKIVLNLRDDFGEKYEAMMDFRCIRSPKVLSKTILNPELDF